MTEPNEIAAEARLLDRALGGWRGLLDSALPTTVFIVGYSINQDALKYSVVAALVVGLVLAGLALRRKASLQSVVSGLLGLAVAAGLTMRTQRAEAFFLPGILTNAAYLTLTLGSLLVRRPVLGYVIESFRGDVSSWVGSPALRRRYAAVTWVWAGVFGIRVATMYPLYLAGAVDTLAVLKIALGWPLFLFAAYVTYAVLRRPSAELQ